MVHCRSKFPKNLEQIARGVVTASSRDKFQVKFSNKMGKNYLQIFEKQKASHYEQPGLGAGVICRYKKIKDECSESKKQIPIEIYSLNGILLYKK